MFPLESWVLQSYQSVDCTDQGQEYGRQRYWESALRCQSPDKKNIQINLKSGHLMVVMKWFDTWIDASEPLIITELFTIRYHRHMLILLIDVPFF